MDTFFFSDPHWGHKNVIAYCGRPYKDITEMKRALIENYNSVVKPFDKVYFLGDIFFCGTIEAKDILKKLNGHKILIRGNHDRNEEKMKEIGFDEVYDRLEIQIDKFHVKLCHFPYRPYTGDINPQVLARIAQIKGEARKTGNDRTSDLDKALDEYPYSNMITKEQKDRLISYDMRFWSRRYEDKGGWLLCGHVHEKWKIKNRMINVGVDVWDYKPVSMDVILSIIKGEYDGK